MKTYSEWARANHVMNHDFISFHDYIVEVLVPMIGEHEMRIAEAFKQEDQRHRYLTNATEKTRRRVNQLERDVKSLREVWTDHDEMLRQDQTMIMQLAEAVLDLERRTLAGRWKSVRGWFTW